MATPEISHQHAHPPGHFGGSESRVGTGWLSVGAVRKTWLYSTRRLKPYSSRNYVPTGRFRLRGHKLSHSHATATHTHVPNFNFKQKRVAKNQATLRRESSCAFFLLFISIKSRYFTPHGKKATTATASFSSFIKRNFIRRLDQVKGGRGLPIFKLL